MCAPIGRSEPHDWHVRIAVVTSTVKISSSTPAMALPSRCISASKALGVDAAGVVADLYQLFGGLLDERRRPAHVHARVLGGRRPGRLDDLAVEPARPP